MACPRNYECVFHQTVEPSVIKRVRYASVYSYCRGGQHAECAVYRALERSLPVPRNLMPDGAIGDYMDDRAPGTEHRFLIIEDSPVFAALASSTIASNFQGAHIVRKLSFEAAVEELANDYHAIICGFGLGGERTAHDVRKHTSAPMIVLTGRPDHGQLPHGARRVGKSEGPEALASAIRACLGSGVG